MRDGQSHTPHAYQWRPPLICAIEAQGRNTPALWCNQSGTHYPSGLCNPPRGMVQPVQSTTQIASFGSSQTSLISGAVSSKLNFPFIASVSAQFELPGRRMCRQQHLRDSFRSPQTYMIPVQWERMAFPSSAGEKTKPKRPLPVGS